MSNSQNEESIESSQQTGVDVVQEVNQLVEILKGDLAWGSLSKKFGQGLYKRKLNKQCIQKEKVLRNEDSKEDLQARLRNFIYLTSSELFEVDVWGDQILKSYDFRGFGGGVPYADAMLPVIENPERANEVTLFTYDNHLFVIDKFNSSVYVYDDRQ